jgi:hypothetical protein
MIYAVVILRLEMEKIKLGMTEENVTRHTNANTYRYLSVFELGTATKSLSITIASAQNFTVHGHGCINSIMLEMVKS